MLLKTLLVDDDRTSLLLLTKILASDAECTSCHSGLEAKEALRSALLSGSPFQLMFIDINLGDVDGRILLKTVRDIETKLSVPDAEKCKIIMITATNDMEIRRECDALGADAYVLKPLDKVVVRSRLSRVGLVA